MATARGVKGRPIASGSIRLAAEDQRSLWDSRRYRGRGVAD